MINEQTYKSGKTKLSAVFTDTQGFLRSCIWFELHLKSVQCVFSFGKKKCFVLLVFIRLKVFH